MQVPKHILQRFFFFLFAHLQERFRESGELLGGPFTSAKGQGQGCLLGASLLARQGDSVWDLEEMLEPSCSPEGAAPAVLFWAWKDCCWCISFVKI